MADVKDHQNDDRQPPVNGSGDDDLPTDVEELQRMLRDRDRKLGQLTNDRARERKAKESVTEQMKSWLALEAKGHTPEEIEQILEQRSQDEVKQAKESGNVDKLIANARRDAEKRAEAAEAARAKSDGLVQRVLIDDVVNRLLDKYVEPKYKRAVFKMLREKFEPFEDPEDEYGMRPVVKVGGEAMSADEWIKQWAETDDEAVPFLKESMAAGGGATGAGAGRLARLSFKARKDMTPAEKSQYIRTHTLAAYQALPWSREGAA